MLAFNRKNKTVTIDPISKVSGVISVDGDKSISHRAVMLSCIANGVSFVKGCLLSEDVKSTIKCFRSMGAKITKSGNCLTIKGIGRFGLKKPKSALDAGNSGTTMRLISGILAGQRFECGIFGDKSLSKRPMARIVEPLSAMGADISGSNSGGKIYPPLRIKGSYPLKTLQWESKIASAQIKSAVLLAGLYTKDGVAVKEPAKSRDHTERMMKSFGIPIKVEKNKVVLKQPADFHGMKINVPGDVSSSAFFAAICSVLKNSKITLKNVGLNSTRTGFLSILKKMGATIHYQADKMYNNEPVGSVKVEYSELKAVKIGRKDIPAVIDEIPLLAVLATQARGRTVISGAEELRVKESDRLACITIELKKMGARIIERKDGLIIDGPVKLAGSACINSYDDHRITMSMAVAALCASGPSRIKGYESADVSAPGFWNTLRKISCE